MSRVARIALLAALACLVIAASAGATPVGGLRAGYAAGGIEVTFRVSSPPSGAGCSVGVAGSWSRIAVRRGVVQAADAAPHGTSAGLVAKAGPDGAVPVDACAAVSARGLWTEGPGWLRFRTGTLGPGAYRVCVRAAQRVRGHGVSAHTACTGFRVAG